MVHPTAVIAEGAEIGANVSFGPFTIVRGNVRIEEGSTIGSHGEIGVPTPLANGERFRVRPGNPIRSHGVICEGSVLGAGRVTGHRVTVRELTRAGTAPQMGTLSDIQGHCAIGDYVLFHSNVHIGQKSATGNFVSAFPVRRVDQRPTCARPDAHGVDGSRPRSDAWHIPSVGLAPPPTRPEAPRP